MALCSHEGYPCYGCRTTAVASPRARTGLHAPCCDSAENQACARSCWRTAQGTQECRQTHVRRNTCLAGVLCTVAALPGAAAREIRAWDGVATSCVDRRATDAPDAAPLTGRLQELGAQHRARILPGALTLVLASRPPPRLSWSTTFKRGLTVERRFRLLMRTRHGHLHNQTTLGSRLGSLY